MRPVNPDSASLVLGIDPVDGVKEELADVSRATGLPAAEIAVRVLLHCKGRYARIVDRTGGTSVRRSLSRSELRAMKRAAEESKRQVAATL